MGRPRSEKNMARYVIEFEGKQIITEDLGENHDEIIEHILGNIEVRPVEA